MPSKPTQHRHRKPFNALERKIQKKKHELIHKAAVKSQYQKTQAKQDAAMNTPDYVKQIFAERTVDDDGNVKEYEHKQQQKPNPYKTQLEIRKKTKQQAEEERAAKAKAREEKKEAKMAYQKGRDEERVKMMSKTRRGQPNMATQMDVLLGRIKKQVAKE